MKKPHYLSIDGDLLQTFVAVYTDESISKAAVTLGQSQSTLSHRLERLRTILDDPLFVRAGRRIAATRRAEEIIDQAKEALSNIRSISEVKSFDPATMTEKFVIAATDYERAVFLIDAYKDILTEAPNVSISFVWEKYSNSEALRKGQFDFAISPVEDTNEQDIRRRPLFSDTASCFYDKSVISAPKSLDDYLSSIHASVIFSERDISFIDGALQILGKSRKISARVPSVSEIPRIIEGTSIIATLPHRLSNSIMASYGVCKPPFDIRKLNYALFWHDRTHNSPKHIWLRQKLIEAAGKLTKSDPGKAKRRP